MLRLTHLFAACLLASSPPTPRADLRLAADERDDPTASSEALPRLEDFVLELGLDPEPKAAAAPARSVGLVEWRRRRIRGGMQLECDTLFERAEKKLDCQRVLHVENLAPPGPSFVWREVGNASGRSLLVEWTPDGGGLSTCEYGGNGARRDTFSTGGGAVMPLYLLELARNGRVTSGRFLLLDPISRSLLSIELTTTYRLDDGKVGAQDAARRTVELRRDDGTLAGRYEFRGVELLAFQWQEGGLRARRIPPQEYAERCAAALSVAVAPRPGKDP